MREIKFRVWCEARKEMLPIQRHSFKTNKSMPYGWNMQYEFDAIMQYTGLKDKNGKEIYEGDIISIVDSIGTHICEVKFLNGCFVSVKVGEGDSDRVCLCEDIDNFPHTIIGNIYENPKLLQVNN